MLCGVLGVTQRLAGFSLRLVHLTFGLQFLVVHHLPGRILHGAFSLVSSGFHIFAEQIAWWFQIGASVFRVGTGFSLALLGAGYLVGIVVGIAMIVGGANAMIAR